MVHSAAEIEMPIPSDEPPPILLRVGSHSLATGILYTLLSARYTVIMPTDYVTPSSYLFSLPDVLITTSDDPEVVEQAAGIGVIVVARTFLSGLELVDHPRIRGVLVDVPDSLGTHLPRAIQAVKQGQRYVLPELLLPMEGDGLSRKEVQVLVLTALGYGGDEIAARLKLRRNRIYKVRTRIMERLNITLNMEQARDKLLDWWQARITA